MVVGTVLTGGEVDTLVAAVENGPVWSGDIPSKDGRSRLVERGFLFATVVKGEQGFVAVTPLGVKAYMQLFGTSMVDGSCDSINEAKANRLARQALNTAQRKPK